MKIYCIATEFHDSEKHFTAYFLASEKAVYVQNVTLPLNTTPICTNSLAHSIHFHIPKL